MKRYSYRQVQIRKIHNNTNLRQHLLKHNEDAIILPLEQKYRLPQPHSMEFKTKMSPNKVVNKHKLVYSQITASKDQSNKLQERKVFLQASMRRLQKQIANPEGFEALMGEAQQQKSALQQQINEKKRSLSYNFALYSKNQGSQFIDTSDYLKNKIKSQKNRLRKDKRLRPKRQRLNEISLKNAEIDEEIEQIKQRIQEKTQEGKKKFHKPLISRITQIKQERRQINKKIDQYSGKLQEIKDSWKNKMQLHESPEDYLKRLQKQCNALEKEITQLTELNVQ